jgi:hypothetical protein
MSEEIFEKAFNHILSEIGIYNIIASIKRGNFETLRKAHDSTHEFIYLAPLSVSKERNLDEKSAFLKVYLFEIFFAAHNSFLMALTGFYNSAYTLLRIALELLIKGTMWECLAHKKFRENSEILQKEKVKIGNLTMTIIDWLNEIIKQEPSIEEALEKTSAGIFDKIYPLPEDPQLKKLIPPVKKCIEQLSKWEMFDPIPDPEKNIYNLYSSLSADVHVAPDRTDIGRRLLAEKELYEVRVIPDELNKYCEQLKEVMDIGIVLELNILKDWIVLDKEIQNNLKARLEILEDLGLSSASKKLLSLLKFEEE